MIGELPDAVTSMPYGVAMDCAALYSATGIARIDLRDTPFLVSDSFMQCGYLPGGASTFSEDDQVVELTGGGYCGWTQPDSEAWLDPPFNDAGGPQPILELDYLHPERRAAFQLKNDVALYGGFNGTETDVEERDWEANATILSGDIGIEGDASDNAYHVFYHPDGTDLDNTAVLDGFTVTGGNADGDAQRNTFGAGMFNDHSSPTLTNCTFTGNSASWGGGMFNWYSSPPLSNCTFEGNSSLEMGGGMANFGFTAALTDCTFSGNSAGTNGGGIYESNSSSPVLTNCSFTGNSATYDGGGMYDTGGSPVLTNCTFKGNSAGIGGGGMHVYNGSSPELSGCTFSGNSARDGGAMQNSTFSSPLLTNCTFADNEASSEGGGLYNIWSSSPTLTNCTFTGNSAADGGAISNYESSSPTLTNCILWDDTSPEVFGTVMSEPVITYSDIDGGYTGVGNIDVDPLFVDAGSGDYHLAPGSPCIDAGLNTAPDLPAYDFEGDPRIVDGDLDGVPTADMGIDEVSFSIYLPLVLRGY